jgi:hypothetical protein
MKDLKIAVLAALMTAVAAPLLAGPRLCGNGLPPQLSGDLFSPAECSTTTKPAAMLPGLTVVLEGKQVKNDLKDLDGRWEGNLVHALGRYELLLTVKAGRGGKAELTLDMKELQFHERLTDRMSLVPAKGRGDYEATLTTTLVPDVTLKGSALIGEAVLPEDAAGKPLTADRQADFTFSNGAVHRVYFALKDRSEMRVRAFSGIPGAPLQKFELVLTKTKRQAL